jgi:hypothetical protein
MLELELDAFAQQTAQHQRELADHVAQASRTRGCNVCLRENASSWPTRVAARRAFW